jgi:hypothetical protein
VVNCLQGTFDEAQLLQTLALGVNRVSLGVQSFDEAMLRRCGRSHGVDEVAAATALMRTHAPSWSLDLISSLPYQTPEGWCADLDAAVAAKPNHVSIYDLQVLCSHQPHCTSPQLHLRDTLRPGNKRGLVKYDLGETYRGHEIEGTYHTPITRRKTTLVMCAFGSAYTEAVPQSPPSWGLFV